MPLDGAHMNTEAIVNASELVNLTLISKGYVDEKLYFPSINWPELVEEQVQGLKTSEKPRLDELQVTNAIYRNDRNVINIIYSLLQSIDRNKVQNKTFNKVISQKDATIRDLEKRIGMLENQVAQTESKLDRTVQFDQHQLSKRVLELTYINKLQTQDLNRLKNWCADVKTKYHVELKKKSIEINNLTNSLLEKRNLSSTTTLGLPLGSANSKNNDTTWADQNVNSNIIYNHNPIIDNTNLNRQLVNLQPVLDKQYEQIVLDLTQLIENLVLENYRFSVFIKRINDYYQTVNSQLNNVNNKSWKSNRLPNPSSMIDLNELENLDKEANPAELADKIESFELVSRPLLNNVYKNYHYMVNLLEQVDSGAYSLDQTDDKSNLKKIEKLKSELEVVTKNWQDAIKTLDNWRSYQAGGNE